MCGFLGEFSFNSGSTTNSDAFSRLLQLSKHRGPDSTEILRNRNYQLGFNRLAILDTSVNGNQPMSSPSGRYVVVFNGEIYNYKELQKRHHLKHLKSTSDTEVLVNLLDKFGIHDTVNMLNGMFAIAIIDTIDTTVSLARDFAGIKPLFFGKSKKGVVFASQFDQIFKHNWHSETLRLRPEVMKDYFGFGFMQAPNTIYEAIFQLTPGEIIQFSLKGEMLKKSYLKFSKHALDRSVNKSNKDYSAILKSAVNRQLISDVPLASFLSGGIDSPLIAAIAKEYKTDIEAYTFGIDNKKFDESRKAEIYAKHLGITHFIDKAQETDILSSIETHFRYLPEPFGDYSSVPTFLITERARQSHTVMLSGDGGDELFFGYPRMQDIFSNKNFFLIPYLIRKPLVAILNRLHLRKTWGAYNYRTIAEWVKGKQLYISTDILQTFFREVDFSKEVDDLFTLPKFKNKNHFLHWLRWNEFYGHLQRILIKVDRTSMANSLEVRVPFLDKESINYAWGYTPSSLKNNEDLKKVLKDNLAMYYPKKIIQTQKKGFSVPIENWLRNELRENVEDFIFKKSFYGETFIDVDSVKAYVSDFYNKKHNNGWGVWHIYAWQKWAYAHLK